MTSRTENLVVVRMSEPLRRSHARAVSLSLPVTLSQRLDDLVHLVEGEARESTSRRELFCALLYAAKPDADWLKDVLDAYRKATVRESFVDQPRAGRQTYKWEPPSAGPRPRTAEAKASRPPRQSPG